MTAFSEQPKVVASLDLVNNAQRPAKWSLSNWPVRWKVFAIVVVPLLLAGAFGGLRVYAGWTEARDLEVAADSVDMLPAIEKYMSALDDAMLTNSTGADAQASLSTFDTSKQNLQRQLADTDVGPDVRTGVTSLLNNGQALLDQVMANGIDLRGRITAYAPLLLTAEDAITGTVRVDDERIRAQTLGLSRAVGARGQMMMQQLLVNLGGSLPEPELRTSMITLAGTEPSTLFGMSQVLGVGSPDAQKLQEQMVGRMATMSDPAIALVGNPELTQSLQTTNGIAKQLVDSTTTSVTAAVADQANARRQLAIRDSAIVGVAMLLALVIVLLVARTLVRPLRRLRDGALKVAHSDLARELERLRAGGEPGPVRPLPVNTTEEVGQVAHAVDELHEQALLLAGEQARLQLQVGDMFETLSRRSRSLVDQQLGVIDQLERNEEDPDRLESLFKLDHLAARMRRNGANLLVLAGSRVPREQAEPVPVAALINAAASEVEDYARVVAAVVPASEVQGVVAGDLVHVLAELLDNALRYSPPISQVQVSAVHTGNGGLVIEVSDVGLGMTDSDLRVANTRLQSGGEVNPYTARHMGLFVVGRLAAQHGLVIRLRSTVAGEPNSGTTAGVFIPAELLLHGVGDPGAPLDYRVPTESELDTTTTTFATADVEPAEERRFVASEIPEAAAPPEYRNGYADAPIGLLPQRNPGASGISDIPSAPIDHMPAPVAEPVAEWPAEQWEPIERPRQAPADTSSFFAARGQGEPVSNNAPAPSEPPRPEPAPAAAEPAPAAAEPAPAAAEPPPPVPVAAPGGSIFDKMLSEWLIDDPNQLAESTDLDWQTVWDHGWSAAAAAEEAPVAQHTENGLPVRQPGARLVPGAAGNGSGGGAHRGPDDVGADGLVGDDSTFDTGPIVIPREPDAVRSSIGSHFDGVHAGRAQAREGGRRRRETDDE